MVKGCLACDLTGGRAELPGGVIYRSEHWVLEPCIGPLPVGALILKPLRHITHLWELSAAEAAELGPLLKRASTVISTLSLPDQVYVCLWSHAGWQAGHVHFVLQPAWNSQQAEHSLPGPMLQADLFAANQAPDHDAVRAFAERAREMLSSAG
jgi:diadenosine tetraphosphate (Ap4A) HIT family hydrolase